ncbi:MAG: type II secretion system protein M [Burkholderiales bacterium]
MDSARTMWLARTPRERFALTVAAGVIAALLLYSFVWEPVRAERARLRESLPQLRAQAAQFASDAAEASRLRASARGQPPSVGGATAVEAAAEQIGVRANITSITEVSGGRLQVALEPVPYEALVRWIGELARSAGLAVESVQLRPSPKPGIVIVESLVFKGAEGP